MGGVIVIAMDDIISHEQAGTNLTVIGCRWGHRHHKRTMAVKRTRLYVCNSLSELNKDRKTII